MIPSCVPSFLPREAGTVRLRAVKARDGESVSLILPGYEARHMFRQRLSRPERKRGQASMEPVARAAGWCTRGSFLQSESSRRGAVAPLTAIMMVPLLGLVAFAIDAGWMALSRSGLQDAADAAALAGAQQLLGQTTPSASGNGSYVLQNGFTQYYMPGGGGQQTMIVNAATAAAIKSASRWQMRLPLSVP